MHHNMDIWFRQFLDVFNLRTDGGEVFRPNSVFPYWSENGDDALSYILFACVVKISDPAHPRSGHQVTSRDLTS